MLFNLSQFFILTIVKPLLCETPYMVDRCDSEERLMVRLFIICDALHLTDIACDDFVIDIGIIENKDLEKLINIVRLNEFRDTTKVVKHQKTEPCGGLRTPDSDGDAKKIFSGVIPVEK
jgi:hypothetical protein